MRVSFKNFLLLLLPGVFAQSEIYKERALAAESSLSAVVGQMESVVSRILEESRAERQYLMSRLVVDTALPLPPPTDTPGATTLRGGGPQTHPIARVLADARKQEQELFQDDAVVDIAVDEYLRRMSAQ